MYRRYHCRVSVLGGVDVDLLSRGSVDGMRRRTREILDAGAPEGGYCLGSGNTVTNYIPVQNYLVMLDEGRHWTAEHSPD